MVRSLTLLTFKCARRGQVPPRLCLSSQPADLTAVNSYLSLNCVISIKTLSAQKAKFNILCVGKAVNMPAGWVFHCQDPSRWKHILRQVCSRKTDPRQTPLTEQHQSLEICMLRFDVRPAAEEKTLHMASWAFGRSVTPGGNTSLTTLPGSLKSGGEAVIENT